MTKENKKKVAANGFDFGLGGLLGGIEKLVDLAQKLQESGGEVKKEGEFDLSHLKKDMKGVFGFSVKSMAGGKPIVEPFGNIKKTPKGPQVAQEREPITDVFDEVAEVKVYAEMPGVNEEGISVELRGDILEIKAVGKDRQYHKEVLLPAKVNHETLVKSYKNGILEVIIKKS
ncbi:MAG: Hsp20/alpha crystallin family protein [Chrysiogenales bacterium]